MANVQYIRSGDGTINIFCGGKPYTVSADLPTYAEIDRALKAGEVSDDNMLSLLNIKVVVQEVARRSSQGRVEVDLDAGVVKYDGVAFPDKALCDRILRLMSEGQPFQYMINFLERLGKNPNFRSVLALFGFISAQGFPITPEGKFLAYKGIDQDWKDCYSHTVDNHVGAVNKMPREKCDSDRRNACSVGFHVGTHEYAKGWAQGHVVLVEVDPADVISVPDSNLTWKLRCCEYKVIADHTDLGLLTGEVYDSTGKAVPAKTFGQFDNDTADHWDACEGRTYDPADREDDEEEDFDDEDEDLDEDEDWEDDNEDEEEDDEGAWD